MTSRVTKSLLAVLFLLPVLSCDKASPVAPNGTVLTISANPSQIGLNGSSTITVVGRKPDGNPLNPGTEIRLSTDRGTIDSMVTTGDGGRATATFRGDGRLGAAMITARTGSGDVMVMTTVQVGQAEGDRPTVLVSVTPSTVVLGAEAEITVVARNADGTPVARGERVTLTTTLGTISPANLTIGANGTATATLDAGSREGTATITAIVGSSADATAMVMIITDGATAINVTVNPASVREDDANPKPIIVTATVVNSRGLPVVGALVTFQSELGDFGNSTSETTDVKGQATKTLTIRTADLVGTARSFRISARTPSSSGGAFLEGSTDVSIIRSASLIP